MRSDSNPRSAEVCRRDQVFNAPRAYDLAFGWDISNELRVVSRLAGLNRRHRLLIPACGTGRYAAALAEHGYRIAAFDVNESMIAFAREHRPHPLVRYSVADMTTPLEWDRRTFDGAILFCNSFRYILAQAEVRSHLGEMRRVIVPGGVYVLELDLNVGLAHCDQPNAWTARYEDVEVDASWTLASVDPPHATERVELTLREGNSEHSIRELQRQRLWSADELSEQAESRGWHVDGFFDRRGARVTARDVPNRYYVLLRNTDESP
jgi:SAM-dependent methyltransferase